MSLLEKHLEGEGFAPVRWGDYLELARDGDDLVVEGFNPRLLEDRFDKWVLFVPKGEEVKAKVLIGKWEREWLEEMERAGLGLPEDRQ